MKMKNLLEDAAWVVIFLTLAAAMASLHLQ